MEGQYVYLKDSVIPKSLDTMVYLVTLMLTLRI